MDLVILSTWRLIVPTTHLMEIVLMLLQEILIHMENIPSRLVLSIVQSYNICLKSFFQISWGYI
jgi:hypothetical protein